MTARHQASDLSGLDIGSIDGLQAALDAAETYADAKVSDAAMSDEWLTDPTATETAPSQRSVRTSFQSFEDIVVTYVGGSIDALTQDDIEDGTTYKQYSQTEKTKLGGIATGATANDTDANLKARANHTGTQAASTISDFDTAADARIAAATATGSGSLVRNTTPAITNPTVTNYIETAQAISNSGTAKTFDLSTGTIIPVTMTGNCTFTMPAANAGKSFVVPIYTGAGAFTGTFTGVKWPGGTAPTLTTTASRLDLASFFCDGTSWYGSIVQNYTP
jgi:hypothetical protein